MGAKWSNIVQRRGALHQVNRMTWEQCFKGELGFHIVDEGLRTWYR